MNIADRFKGISLTRFLEEVDNLRFACLIKRLSGNDTNLTGGHQVGLYIPREYVNAAIPEINTTETSNPSAIIDECYFPSEDYHKRGLRAVYYNSKHFPERNLAKKYDEFRITRWGGRQSPNQNPEATGSVFILAIGRVEGDLKALCWLASTLSEERVIEEWLGEEVEPGRCHLKAVPQSQFASKDIELPPEWLVRFPKGREVFEYVIRHTPNHLCSMDRLILRRTILEFDVFKKLEHLAVMPSVRGGFSSVDTFLEVALSVANRRKSRAGGSLELNLELIFRDNGLRFERQAITENKKKPDFLFPSSKAYHDESFDSHRLHMLGAKTSCKDRWRQILNEANRIACKHLFTLQEGLSENQLREMESERVVLVAPEPNHGFFPKGFREKILSLESFVQFIRK